MTAYIAGLGKRSIAFGLTWTLLSGTKSVGAEVKAQAAVHKAANYVSVSTGRRNLVGLLPRVHDVESGANRRAVAAAAAVLSSAYKGKLQNAVFGIPLPNGKAAAVCFREGLPLVGFDRVVSYSEFDDLVDEYLNVLGKGAGVVFYGEESLFGHRDCHPFDLRWFADADPAAIGTSTLRRVKKPIVAIGVLLAMVSVSAFGYDYYATVQAQKAKKAKVAVIDPEKLYSDSVKGLLEEAGYPAIEVAWQAIAALNRLPLLHQGWKLEKANCDIGRCVLTWLRTDEGTYQTFHAAPLQGVTVTGTEYKEDPNHLATTVTFPMNAKQGVNREQLPSKENFVVQFGSRVQELKAFGLPIVLQKSVVIGVPGTPPGQQPISEATLASPVYEGSWTLDGPWEYNDAIRSLPINLTLSNIDLQISDAAIVMSLKGKYYVKK